MREVFEKDDKWSPKKSFKHFLRWNIFLKRKIHYIFGFFSELANQHPEADLSVAKNCATKRKALMILKRIVKQHETFPFSWFFRQFIWTKLQTFILVFFSFILLLGEGVPILSFPDRNASLEPFLTELLL